MYVCILHNVSITEDAFSRTIPIIHMYVTSLSIFYIHFTKSYKFSIHKNVSVDKYKSIVLGFD